MHNAECTYRTPPAHWAWQLLCATIFVLVASTLVPLATCGLIYVVAGPAPLQLGPTLGLVTLFATIVAYYAFTKELRYVRLDYSICTLGFLIGVGSRQSSQLTAVFVGPPRESLGTLRRLVLQFGTFQQKIIWLPDSIAASFLYAVRENLRRSIILPDPAIVPDIAASDPLLAGHLKCSPEYVTSLAAAAALRRKFLAAAIATVWLAIPIPFGVYALVTGQLGPLSLLGLVSSVITSLAAAATAFHFAQRVRSARRQLSFLSSRPAG